MSEIRSSLIEELAGQSEEVTNLALRTPLDGLTFFLQYAGFPRRGLSTIRRDLIKGLTGKAEKLAELAVHAPLDALLSFLETIPFAKDVWHLIDLDDWNRYRENEAPIRPNFIVNLSKTVRGPLGRPELAWAPARNQIIKFDPGLWRGEVIYTGIPQITGNVPSAYH
ncbi:MAG: hypothetical protein WA624_13655 [Methylocella sp.]